MFWNRDKICILKFWNKIRKGWTKCTFSVCSSVNIFTQSHFSLFQNVNKISFSSDCETFWNTTNKVLRNALFPIFCINRIMFCHARQIKNSNNGGNDWKKMTYKATIYYATKIFFSIQYQIHKQKNWYCHWLHNLTNKYNHIYFRKT